MPNRNNIGMLRATLVAAVAIFAIVMVPPGIARPAPQDAHKPATTAAPVPIAIPTAKRIFLGNAGVDGVSISTFQRAGDRNQPYDLFYAALKNWGRYELVATPSDADLVFELSFAAPLSAADKISSYAPHLRLEIFDAKSRFLLWAIVAPVEAAYRKATWDKNFSAGITSLVAELKNVSASSLATDK